MKFFMSTVSLVLGLGCMLLAYVLFDLSDLNPSGSLFLVYAVLAVGVLFLSMGLYLFRKFWLQRTKPSSTPRSS